MIIMAIFDTKFDLSCKKDFAMRPKHCSVCTKIQQYAALMLELAGFRFFLGGFPVTGPESNNNYRVPAKVPSREPEESV